MNDKLIIKRISNDFDLFVVNNISSYCPFCDVVDIFLPKGRIGRRIVNFSKKNNLIGKLPFLLRVNEQTIAKYNQVLIFDDFPDLPLIKWIKSINSDCDIKVWFWNVPDYSIEDYKKYAKLYCFDKEYCRSNDIFFEEQFYFEPKEIGQKEQVVRDLLYIGADKNRTSILETIAEEAKKQGIKYDFILIKNGITDLNHNHNGIQYLNNPLSYEDVLIENRKSKAILEIVREGQTGLTWRCMEALYLNKKLITNNRSIINSQFYNPDNMYIIGINKKEELGKFIDDPFKPIDSELLRNASFERWAGNMNLL